MRMSILMLALFGASTTAGLAADNPHAGEAAGDVVLVDPQPEPWGGASDTALVVGAFAVTPPNSTITWLTSSSNTGIGISQTSQIQTNWYLQFHVPSGARLQRVVMEACDNSATASISFGIRRGVVPGGPIIDVSVQGSTGATPGCGLFTTTPTAPTTIDNAGNNYWVFFNWSGTGFDPSIHVHSFRIYYRLQVSPAPATATFPNDVPTTHPFFRFVEAMAASGLTGGCSAGSFCPDSPVTRGQMAVFLASALGLHFPN